MNGWAKLEVRLKQKGTKWNWLDRFIRIDLAFQKNVLEMLINAADQRCAQGIGGT